MEYSDIMERSRKAYECKLESEKRITEIAREIARDKGFKNPDDFMAMWTGSGERVFFNYDCQSADLDFNYMFFYSKEVIVGRLLNCAFFTETKEKLQKEL